MEKECFCCKQTKPIVEFYKAKGMVDWGRIDKLACLRYADQLLDKEK
jgi:hypothetical protein